MKKTMSTITSLSIPAKQSLLVLQSTLDWAKSVNKDRRQG